ncbi:MAG TPA: response regulator [Cyclobacteriaceae bacterium]|jgi:DNA-binding LytR/AlgR family response regulator|nr:response regulator [Cyclobacteriaceae bacterium]
MEKIKVLIVEDKLIIAQDIAARLTKHALEVVGICSTGEEAIERAMADKPDLILMDIELEGAIDGISAAQLILKEQPVPIIFLSDYTDSKTVERALKTKPSNYLTKPFNEVDLIRAIDLAFSNARAQNVSMARSVLSKDVFLRTDSQAYIKLAIHDILYLEADRAYCSVVTDVKTYKLSSSMNHIHEQLPKGDFIKVHRSYSVNINRITSLEGNMIKIGEHEVQMSREYREELMSLLKIIK